MVRHSERFSKGLDIVLALALVVGLLVVVYWLGSAFVVPFIMEHAGVFKRIGIGLVVFVVVTYILGYLVTDFKDDLESVSEE